ncbi:ABC-F family ATP-binding cassette domain-containing protein [Longirhabdus pacifica]|uniref:ABC-F family ATP-binding cassette domain-containing protein n=1 Tax=Longirhabdus pacifica TaxID=2305227 RepID=UPI0010089779|nr:ABC-F family ATP-binding cassette domain-containing protein [Longirhabdus pacifica]
MSLLTVDRVMYSHGDKHIFNRIYFRLLHGEHIGLVGSNGCGKSTLIRMLAGDIIPDDGAIHWLPNTRIGYLQQHADLQRGVTMYEFLQTAFSHLYVLERKMHQLADDMSKQSETELPYILKQYGEIQQQLEQANFYHLDVKIEEVAAGLGLIDIGLQKEMQILSGGQQTKVLLAKLLLEQPDVLLLDEPTNYLDDQHITWLSDYLKHYPGAYIVVSHDEQFLDEVTHIILHVEQQNIKRYVGNYSKFLSTYKTEHEQMHIQYARQQKEIKKLENFIQKNKVRKAKQAKSREKALQKMEPIAKPTMMRKPTFHFNVAIEPVRVIAQLEEVVIGYDHPLLSPINLNIRRGDKIAVVGYNGIGKTTLLKTKLHRIQPLSGSIALGDRVKIAYFSQTLSLQTEGVKITAHTPLDYLCAFRRDMTHRQIRQLLAKVGLDRDHIEKDFHLLSGGEQAKVRLCELMLTESNVLILDEPTNHLDAVAKSSLREALKEYQGTIILVSHEPAFYEDWITKVLHVEQWKL